MKPKTLVSKAGTRYGLFSTLPKKWNKFLVLKDYAILVGHFNQAHKRYKGKDKNASSSICVIACAIAKLNKTSNWGPDTLDTILELGMHLYAKTIQVLNNKCLGILKPTQVYRYFFLDDLKITMSIGIDTLNDKLHKDSNYLLALDQILNKFLTLKEFGIVVFHGQRFFAIWKQGDDFFMFDPVEHEEDGTQWQGISSRGFCNAMKFKNTRSMAAVIIDNVVIQQITSFMIYPCLVEKVVKVDVTPPETIEGRKGKILDMAMVAEFMATGGKPGKKPKEAAAKKPKPKSPVLLPDGTPITQVPPEKPKIQSETKFAGIPASGGGDGKAGILRASTHQADPKFSRYKGTQGLSNAVAALTMLRLGRCKYWTKKHLDHVLKLGEWIHHESKKLPPGQVTDKVKLNENFYVPKINKFRMVGVLGSDKPDVWDLKPALTNFFAEHDCCILNGPHTVAIWLENGLYYMFDPNERDAAGRTNKNEPGVACVTWYDNLKSLVDTYMSNVPIAQKTERFFLSEVKIKNFIELPENWNNFKALSSNKWILRATMSQNAPRFPNESRGVQCTAMATMSLVFAKLKELENWDASVMDQLLVQGDILYRDSVNLLRENGKYQQCLLMVDEMVRSFPVDNRMVDLEILDCRVNGPIKGPSDPIFPNLALGLVNFFDEYEAGVITACNQSFSVFKKNDAFYYFDSHTRDEKGVGAGFGTACILRHLEMSDLVKSLLSNIGACRVNAYNVSAVIVRLIDQTDSGIIKPPLNNFTEINDYLAILRGTFSEEDAKFDLNRGYQTIPNCLVAMALNQLNTADIWNKQELDQILDLGDKLYAKTMEEIFDVPLEQMPPDEEFEDGRISSRNVKKEIKIGKNKFEVEFEDLGQGTFEANLKEILETLRPELPPEEEPVEEEGDEEVPAPKPRPEPEAFNFQILLESPLLNVAIWKDGHSIFLYDPKPRDENGQIYGKDEWSVIPVEEEEEEQDSGEEDEDENEDEDEDEDKEEDDAKAGGDFNNDIEDDLDEAFEDATKPAIVEKKGSPFWRQKSIEDGKSCLLRFSKLSSLINHLVENTPPTRREEMEFTIKTVKLTNKPIVKEIFDPESDVKKDDIVGDWNNFKEIDYGRWTLRGNRNLTDELYLAHNRGKQEIPVCLNALAFAKMFALSKYKMSTIDQILNYGDRLMSFMRKLRLKELKMNKDLGLTEEECDEIVKTMSFKLDDYIKKMCIQEKMVTADIVYDVIMGDFTSKIPEEIPDLVTGLTRFFEGYDYGLFECQNHMLALWKKDGVFYMFDPQPRGPNGVKTPIGVPCITRFINVEWLAKILKMNLPKFGDGFFQLHHVTMTQGLCPRERQPEEVIEKPKKLGGFQMVVPGRFILRGDLKLDYTVFDRGVHLHSPAISFVALTMSLIQKPETWTKLVVNEILQVGGELYNETVERLAPKFNPYLQTVDIYKIPQDFTVGSLKVNTALRYMEQRGIVDIKVSKIPNLRQGLERFFDENSHGVLFVSNLVLPVWEEEREGEETVVYMYDPNPRGPTGLPTTGGVACVMKFCNAVVLADHVMACLMGVDKSRTEYSIVPVEIVVGQKKTCRKRKKESPCEREKRLQKQEQTKGVCKLATQIKTPCKAKKDSNLPVVCPSKCVAVEQKRTLRMIADEDRKAAEAKKLALKGRKEWHKLNENESLVRSLRPAKPNTELAACVVAFVLLKVTNLDKLTVKNMEIILTCAQQYYTDCYNTYNPLDRILTPEMLLRRFFVQGIEAKIVIHKPIPCNVLNADIVLNYLSRFFVRANFCLFNYKDKWVSILSREGYFYLFDPYSRSLCANKDLSGKGAAIVLKVGDLAAIAERICNNLKEEGDDEENEKFSIIFVTLQSIVKKQTKPED